MDSDSASTSALKVIVSVASLPLKASVANTLWVWHLTPVIGVSAPGIWHCMGLVVLISLVFHQYAKPNDLEGTYYWWLVLGPLFALFLGWVCK